MKRTHRAPSRWSVDQNTIILIRQIVLGLLIFGFIGGVLLGVWYGSRVSWLTINTVSISGGETIDHAIVRSAVESELDGTYVGLIPRRFAWLFPYEHIITVVSAIPRISTVAVTRTSGTELEIRFDEYTPVALWCAGIATTTCTFLDQSGYAFASAPSLQGGDLIRFVSLSTSTPTVGSRPFSVADMEHMIQLRTLLQSSGWYVTYIEIDAVRDVYLHLDGGGELKATLTMIPEQTVANLETALTAPEFSDISPGNFSYIDLRFGNKVFVNEEQLVATSTDFDVTSEITNAPSQSDGAISSSSLFHEE